MIGDGNFIGAASLFCHLHSDFKEGGGKESGKGLGFMIASAATNYKVDVVFVGVVIFMVLSLILTLSVKKIESNLSRWRPETAKSF